MKNLLSNRLTTLAAAAVVCGVAYAASPLPTLWQETIEVTDHHQRITAGAGHFVGEMSMTMPGMPEPMKLPCEETVTALGDLWTTSSFSMEFMGQPFTGASTLGYDPEKGKYVGTWVDSMTTMLTIMEGDYDAEQDAIVMTYRGLDTMTGEMVDMKNVTKHTETGYAVHFFKVVDGTDEPTMTMNMKRTKKAMEAGSSK